MHEIQWIGKGNFNGKFGVGKEKADDVIKSYGMLESWSISKAVSVDLFILMTKEY